MKFLISVHIIILLLLLVSLWVGHGSYPEIWKLEQDIAAQKRSNEAQEDKNRHIQAELEDARVGHAAVEERARSELGMTKKGETFFEIILKPEPKKKTEPSVSHVLSEPK
ncbi:MAG TPA: cell division protein FtsB [Leucothrix mucor]|uniref:Cell division protein FtsB n=1 Tax=Leucothrix mucor TaxID=45248 RepID=A0A7V2WW97_LEUMU|nr:cell division protein FtsB [Leucothrix mucor]